MTFLFKGYELVSILWQHFLPCDGHVYACDVFVLFQIIQVILTLLRTLYHTLLLFNIAYSPKLFLLVASSLYEVCVLGTFFGFDRFVTFDLGLATNRSTICTL